MEPTSRLADIFQDVGKIFLAAAVTGGFLQRVAFEAVALLASVAAMSFAAALLVEQEGGDG